MKDFSDLRSFARTHIPRLLGENGGQMDKEQMHETIERLFAGTQGMPAGLDKSYSNGPRVKRVAIAWAMHDLVD